MDAPENCLSCPWVFMKTHSCPKYFFNQVRSEDLSWSLLYWDLAMGIISGTMYIAIIAMVIMTFLSRTNRKFCILVMVGTQFALCKVLKDFYKERRPEGIFFDSQ